jgi:hypothetical protein
MLKLINHLKNLISQQVLMLEFSPLLHYQMERMFQILDFTYRKKRHWQELTGNYLKQKKERLKEMP